MEMIIFSIFLLFLFFVFVPFFVIMIMACNTKNIRYDFKRLLRISITPIFNSALCIMMVLRASEVFDVLINECKNKDDLQKLYKIKEVIDNSTNSFCINDKKQ